MVKVVFGDNEILVGEGHFLPMKVYCKKMEIAYQMVDNWIFKGVLEEGKNYHYVQDLNMTFIRDEEFRTWVKTSEAKVEKILLLHDHGLSHGQISIKVGLSKTGVRKIISRSKVAELSR